MAKLNIDINTADLNAASGEFDLLPAGWYEVTIEDDEMKEAKTSSPKAPAHYLELKLRLTAKNSAYANRCLWLRLNLINPKPQTADIAKRDLLRICQSVGIEYAPGLDTAVLHNKPLEVLVRHSAPSNGYEAREEVRGFRASTKTATAGAAAPF